MNIVTGHQVIPKKPIVLFKTQHNTTHRPLGQPVARDLTSFLTLAKIQVKKVQEFSPLNLIGMEDREENWVLGDLKKNLSQSLSDLV